MPYALKYRFPKRIKAQRSFEALSKMHVRPLTMVFKRKFGNWEL
jgi:hypothetical protein